MNLRSLWASQGIQKSVSDALEYITKRVNFVFTREHNGETGAHATIHASGPVFERGRSTAMGDWINVPYNAANFAASGGGTWTVDADDQVTYKYMLVGNTMTVTFFITNTDITGSVSILRIAIPAGATAVNFGIGSVLVDNAATGFTLGMCVANVFVGQFIEVLRLGGAPWTATAADNTRILGSISFEIPAGVQ